jgi:hypothetical protein
VTPEQIEIRRKQAEQLRVGDVLQCTHLWPRPRDTYGAGTKFLIQDIKTDQEAKRLQLIPQTGALKEEIWIPIEVYTLIDFLTICYGD